MHLFHLSASAVSIDYRSQSVDGHLVWQCPVPKWASAPCAASVSVAQSLPDRCSQSGELQYCHHQYHHHHHRRLIFARLPTLLAHKPPSEQHHFPHKHILTFSFICRCHCFIRSLLHSFVVCILATLRSPSHLITTNQWLCEERSLLATSRRSLSCHCACDLIIVV